MSQTEQDGHPALLLTLPVEIIKKIATLSSWSTVLNLRLASRRLNTICNDKLVFEEIAKTYHIHDGISTDPWPGPFHRGLYRWDSARYACAVERACKWAWTLVQTEEGSIALCGSLYGAGSWLPHLFALQHPAAFQTDAGHLLRLVVRTRAQYATQDAKLVYILCNMEFCLASKVLYLGRQPEVFQENGILHRAISGDMLVPQCFAYSLSYLMNFCVDDIRINAATRSIERWIPMAVVISLTAALRLNFDHLALPDPCRVLDQSVVNTPPIFRQPLVNTPHDFNDDSGRDFANCHLRAMTSAQFLSTGTWVGICSEGQTFEGLFTSVWRGVFDFGLRKPPMTGIRFRCQSFTECAQSECEDIDDGRVKTKILDSSTGTDGVGDFTIAGDIYIDGTVILNKSYTHFSEGWEWRGHVTPYGIAGVWGSAGEVSGYFWIWKSEWC